MSTLSCVVSKHLNAQVLDYVKDKKDDHRIKTVTHLRRAFKERTCQFDRQFQGREKFVCGHMKKSAFLIHKVCVQLNVSLLCFVVASQSL